MHITCPAHLPFFNLIILVTLDEEYIYKAPHYAVLLQPPVTSFHFSPNTLSLCSFLHVRYQVSHPHKSTAKIQFCII
jgi:hypothetical protein